MDEKLRGCGAVHGPCEVDMRLYQFLQLFEFSNSFLVAQMLSAVKRSSLPMERSGFLTSGLCMTSRHGITHEA